MSPALNVFSGFRDPSHTIASSSIDAANATLGDGANHSHQPCFAGSAATRACTRKSNAADGSILGNSSSSTFTARNSFTCTRHAAHVSRCFSISSRSPSFRRPSTYPMIFFSIRVQLMTSFPSGPLLLLAVLRNEGGQFHPQRFVCPEQQRFQRALRTLQNLRNLSVIQLLILVQQHCRPLLFRQFLNRVPDRLLPRLFDQMLLDVRVLLGDIQRLLVTVLRIRLHWRIQ